MFNSIPPCCIGIILLLGTVVIGRGQETLPGQSVGGVSPSSSTQTASQNQATLQTFQAEQQALSASFDQLTAQGATPAQIQAWQQQNTASIAALQQRALAMSASQAAQPMPYITNVVIPAGASQTLKDFLTERANLENAKAQIYNQQLQSTGTVDPVQVDAQFQKENATALQEQARRSQILAQESASQPQPTPPPLVIPPNATPQMTAFLTARDQLTRDEIAFSNQYTTTTATVREAAMKQWMQENASRFQQVQTLAQNLTSATEAQN